jgi:DNA-binding NarL/FixJ family response regulator
VAAVRPVRVLLVDDDPLVREGLAMMLDGAGEIAIVGQAGDGDEIPRGTSAATVDVVLMDLRMRRQGGLEATRRLRAQAQPPEVIVLTTFDSDHNVLEALRLGASGFLLKAPTSSPGRSAP